MSRITPEGVQSGPTFTDREAAEWFASISQVAASAAGFRDTYTVTELSDPHPPAVDTG